MISCPDERFSHQSRHEISVRALKRGHTSVTILQIVIGIEPALYPDYDIRFVYQRLFGSKRLTWGLIQRRNDRQTDARMDNNFTP